MSNSLIAYNIQDGVMVFILLVVFNCTILNAEEGTTKYSSTKLKFTIVDLDARQNEKIRNNGVTVVVTPKISPERADTQQVSILRNAFEYTLQIEGMGDVIRCDTIKIEAFDIQDGRKLFIQRLYREKERYGIVRDQDEFEILIPVSDALDQALDKNEFKFGVYGRSIDSEDTNRIDRKIADVISGIEEIDAKILINTWGVLEFNVYDAESLEPINKCVFKLRGRGGEYLGYLGLPTEFEYNKENNKTYIKTVSKEIMAKPVYYEIHSKGYQVINDKIQLTPSDFIINRGLAKDGKYIEEAPAYYTMNVYTVNSTNLNPIPDVSFNYAIGMGDSSISDQTINGKKTIFIHPDKFGQSIQFTFNKGGFQPVNSDLKYIGSDKVIYTEMHPTFLRRMFTNSSAKYTTLTLSLIAGGYAWHAHRQAQNAYREYTTLNYTHTDFGYSWSRVSKWDREKNIALYVGTLTTTWLLTSYVVPYVWNHGYANTLTLPFRIVTKPFAGVF